MAHANDNTTSNYKLYPGCYGLDFLSTAHESCNNPRYGESTSEEREELRQKQQDAREYIKTAIDSRHAYNEVFAAVYGNALKLDGWTGTVYCEGEPVASPEDLTHRLARILKRQPPNRAEFNLEYDRTCRENAKNPVAAYLDGLANPEPVTQFVLEGEGLDAVHVRHTFYPDPVTPDTFPEFNELAKHCFGESATTLDNTLLTRWLISAVARAVKPGCKSDSALVLKGEQGIGKTAFFQTLATIPNPLSRDRELVSYFGTLLPRKTVETQQEIQQLWIAEMGEVESTFRAKDISELKAFLTETADLYRAPYARTPQKHKRHVAFCATTNQDNFLTDGTGSRRFWVIDLGNNPINLEWLAANRDRIWACAYHLYLKKEQWWLTEDEADLSESRNAAYQSSTGYEDTLAPVLGHIESMMGNEPFSINPADLLTVCLGIPPERHTKHQRKLGETVRELGYEKKRFSIGGSKLNRYYKGTGLNPVHLTTAQIKDMADTHSRMWPKD